jgi:hypothetical protein
MLRTHCGKGSEDHEIKSALQDLGGHSSSLGNQVNTLFTWMSSGRCGIGLDLGKHGGLEEFKITAGAPPVPDVSTNEKSPSITEMPTFAGLIDSW